MIGIAGVILFLLLGLAASPAPAATLSVSPVSFEIAAPRTNAKLTLQNHGDNPTSVQIRVFRWENRNGAERLAPTRDVVASPPAATLKANGKYTVRIVRVATAPVGAEESYRLLVDQLPQPTPQARSHVSFLIRQSIPVFFTSRRSQQGPLEWSARMEGKNLVLVAANKGSRRVRLTDIEARSQAAPGRMRSKLAGYVLAGSTSLWKQPAPSGLVPGSTLTITAQDENGPVRAMAVVEAAR
jgi:fimbrial chaperone protein